MPIRTAPRFWIWGCQRFEKLPYGCRNLAILMCRGLGIFLTQTESFVETEQMSSVETGQMAAVETGQMSAAETSVLSQQNTSVLSQEQILCVSETWSGPDTSKSPYLDNRRVTFQTVGTPKSRIAVRSQ